MDNAKESDRSNARSDQIMATGTIVSLGSVVCPPAIRTKLRYAARVVMASAAGVYVSQIFSHNSLFDPDVSGGAVQPEGFDQWATLYEEYRVYKCTCKVTFTSVGTTAATSSFRAALVASDTATAESSVDDAAGSPYAKSTYSMGTTNAPRVLTKTITVSTIRGVPEDSVMEEDNYSASTLVSPTERTYWQVYIQPIDLTSSINVFAYVEITYYCDFFTRRQLGVSSTHELIARSDPKKVEAKLLAAARSTPTT